MATAQYLSATDNPFVAVDVQRRGLSFFGEGRQGPTGLGRAGRRGLLRSGRGQRPATPSAAISSAARTGARWGAGRLGVVVTLEQSFQPANSQLLGRRLLAQTQIQF